MNEGMPPEQQVTAEQLYRQERPNIVTEGLAGYERLGQSKTLFQRVKDVFGLGKEQQEALLQSAFHGSPHRFDKFTLDHIGSGEGNQSYGWGLYFAGDRQVAEYYRKNLSDAHWKDVQQYARLSLESSPDTAVADLRRAALTAREDGHHGDAVKYEAAASWIDEGMPERKQGQVYKVDIPEDSKLLNYDKPLSEQPLIRQKQEAIKTLILERNPNVLADLGENWSLLFGKNITGEDFYNTLASLVGGDRNASVTLNKVGVHGLRYLDGNSRSNNKGSHNYVIFDERAIKVLDKFYQRSEATRLAFENRIDALFNGSARNRQGVRVLDRADILDLLGHGDKPLHLVESAVEKQEGGGQTKHPGMTAEQWKKVPMWVDNPVAAFKSDTVGDRIVLVAPELVGDKPVLIVLEPNGEIGGLDAHVLVNAYEKDRPGDVPTKRWVEEKKLLYLNEKESPTFSGRSGLQLPRGVRQLRGYKERVHTDSDLVKYRRARAEKGVNQSGAKDFGAFYPNINTRACQ
jgi:hypothetical protein